MSIKHFAVVCRADTNIGWSFRIFVAFASALSVDGAAVAASVFGMNEPNDHVPETYTPHDYASMATYLLDESKVRRCDHRSGRVA